MRISNTAWTNRRRKSAVGGQSRNGGGFAAMLRQAGVEKGKKQVQGSGSAIKQEPIHVIPLSLGRIKLDDLENPVKASLNKLSAEKRAELNERYRIDEMKPDSEEYRELVRELQKEGVLSPSDVISLPPNTVSIGTNSEGIVTSILTWEGKFGELRESRNMAAFIRDSLSFASERYKDLAEKPLLGKEEKALVSIYESYQDILGALEEIFSEQLNLG